MIKKIPNFREKGTKLPIIPEGTLYSVLYWGEGSTDNSMKLVKDSLVSYGHKQRNGFDYILCEHGDYPHENYYMIKESTVIDLWKKENSYTEDTFVLPEKWFCRANNQEENTVLYSWVNKTFDKWLSNDFHGYDYICSDGEYSNVDESTIKHTPVGYTKITFEQFQKYVLEKQVYTIEDLANGKCVLNTTGGTYDEVQTVLKAAYPNTASIYSEGSKYYWTRGAYYWYNGDINAYGLPEQSIQEFLKQIKTKAMKTYTVEELKENKKLLVYLNSEEEWKQLNALVGYSVTSKFHGPHCYSVAEKSYSTTSKRFHPGAFSSLSIILTLNEIKEMEKQIVGYKLIKPEFKDAYFAIATVTSLGCTTSNCDFVYDSHVYRKVKEAGVLDLWFEPVYKKAEKTIRMGDSFTLRVNAEGIFHGPENITDYVKSIDDWRKTVPTKFGSYDFTVSDISLSKTGCEAKKTSILEWCAVWHEYQNLIK